MLSFMGIMAADILSASVHLSAQEMRTGELARFPRGFAPPPDQRRASQGQNAARLVLSGRGTGTGTRRQRARKPTVDSRVRLRSHRLKKTCTRFISLIWS